MASTKDEITAIAIEHGYTGKKPTSIAGAIDALADTLAGEDVTGSRSISGAVHALAPYIGSGTTLGALVNIEANTDIEFDRTSFDFYVSTAPYDISGETYSGISNLVNGTTNVCSTGGTDIIAAPNGCYIAISAVVPDDWSADSLGVYIGEEELITSGFEYKKLVNGPNSVVFFTMQIPETDYGLYVNFDVES